MEKFCVDTLCAWILLKSRELQLSILSKGGFSTVKKAFHLKLFLFFIMLLSTMFILILICMLWALKQFCWFLHKNVLFINVLSFRGLFLFLMELKHLLPLEKLHSPMNSLNRNGKKRREFEKQILQFKINSCTGTDKALCVEWNCYFKSQNSGRLMMWCHCEIIPPNSKRLLDKKSLIWDHFFCFPFHFLCLEPSSHSFQRTWS